MSKTMKKSIAWFLSLMLMLSVVVTGNFQSVKAVDAPAPDISITLNNRSESDATVYYKIYPTVGETEWTAWTTGTSVQLSSSTANYGLAVKVDFVDGKALDTEHSDLMKDGTKVSGIDGAAGESGCMLTLSGAGTYDVDVEAKTASQETPPVTPPANSNGKLNILNRSNSTTSGSVSYSINGGAPQTSPLSGIDVSAATSITFSFAPAEGYQLDSGRGVSVFVNGQPTSLTAAADGTYTYNFTSPSTNQYELEFEFVSAQGGQNPQPSGNGDTDVVITLQKYDVVMTEMLDDDGNPVIGQNGHPIMEPVLDENGKEIYDYQPHDRLEYVINQEPNNSESGIGGNFVDAYIDVEGNCAVVNNQNAGYSNKTNTVKLAAGYGEAWSKIIVNNKEYEMLVDATTQEQYIVVELSPENLEPLPEGGSVYNLDVKIWPAESDQISMIWTSDESIAEEFEASDMFVENGHVELVSIIRDNEEIYTEGDNVDRESGIDVTDDYGYVQLLKGDSVVVRLVPDYGYQLKSASVNGFELDPQEEVSTFVISDIQSNIHFSGVFEGTYDEAISTSKSVKSANVWGGDVNVADSGNINLSIADNKTYKKDVTTLFDGNAEQIMSLELTLDNVVSKGNGDYWTTNLTDLKGTVGVALELDTSILDKGETYAIVRDHNGKLEELEVEGVEEGYVVFETDKFSTYTLVKKNAVISKVVTSTLAATDITADMKKAGMDSVEKISEKLTKVVEEKLKSANVEVTKENSKIVEAELKFSEDGGKTWVTATPDNFPKEGIKVVIPYPTGTNAADYDFTVAHMFGHDMTVNGVSIKAGDVELPTVEKTKDGIAFTVKGLSPIMITWKKATKATTVTTPSTTVTTTTTSTASPKTGDNFDPRALFVMMISGLGIIYFAKKREEKR